MYQLTIETLNILYKYIPARRSEEINLIFCWLHVLCGYFEILKSNVQLHVHVQGMVEILQMDVIRSMSQTTCTEVIDIIYMYMYYELSSLMRVSRILQLFSPLSFNATILRRIYGGILDNLSMPSILVHVYLTTRNRFCVNVWNNQGAGLTGGEIKAGSASRMSA